VIKKYILSDGRGQKVKNTKKIPKEIDFFGG